MAAINVQPIVIGYPYLFTLQFNVAGGGALFLTSPIPSRVRGEFRIAPNPANSVALAAVDTQDNSLIINSDGSVTMSIPEAATAKFPLGKVWLDFARVDSGVTSAVGVQFQWPTIYPVTAALT